VSKPFGGNRLMYPANDPVRGTSWSAPTAVRFYGSLGVCPSTFTSVEQRPLDLVIAGLTTTRSSTSTATSRGSSASTITIGCSETHWPDTARISPMSLLSVTCRRGARRTPVGTSADAFAVGVGTHGWTGGLALLRSVSWDVVERGDCTVIVVRP
jgi:hypothetical protein